MNSYEACTKHSYSLLLIFLKVFIICEVFRLMTVKTAYLHFFQEFF